MARIKTPKSVILSIDATDVGDCLFELEGPVTYGVRDDVFKVTIWGRGFEASRFISRKELQSISDWCIEAIAKTEAA
jgi:hypothetical protein